MSGAILHCPMQKHAAANSTFIYIIFKRILIREVKTPLDFFATNKKLGIICQIDRATPNVFKRHWQGKFETIYEN